MGDYYDNISLFNFNIRVVDFARIPPDNRSHIYNSGDSNLCIGFDHISENVPRN